MKATLQLPPEFDIALDDKIRQTVAEVLQELPATSPTLPAYFDIKAGASYAGVSRSTFNGWIKKGMPVFTEGRMKRVKRTDIDAYIKNHSV